MRFNPGKIIDEQFGIGKNGIVKRASRKAGKLNIGFIEYAMLKTGKVKKRHPDTRADKRAVRKTSMSKRAAGQPFPGKVNTAQSKPCKIHAVKIGTRLQRCSQIRVRQFFIHVEHTGRLQSILKKAAAAGQISVADAISNKCLESSKKLLEIVLALIIPTLSYLSKLVPFEIF